MLKNKNLIKNNEGNLLIIKIIFLSSHIWAEKLKIIKKNEILFLIGLIIYNFFIKILQNSDLRKLYFIINIKQNIKKCIKYKN